MSVQTKGITDVAIAKSFKELVKKQPIDKITIKEITDGAGVIRPTFYNHFQDKYELLEWIIDKELIEPIEPLIENGMAQEGFMLLFRQVEKEKDFYMQASRLEGQNSFDSIVKNCITKELVKVMEARTKGKGQKYMWLTPERLAQYYAQSMSYVVITWVRSGMTITAKELSEIYSYVIKRSMDDIIDEL